MKPMPAQVYKVDATYRTNVPSVSAIGDLIPGPALSHPKASTEAIAAVENMAGLPGEVNYDALPSVVWPKRLGVGLTGRRSERQIPFHAETFPFTETAGQGAW
ncbi:MAG: hypothetical protein R2941_09550 [Desulfobacterales bacterium]